MEKQRRIEGTGSGTGLIARSGEDSQSMVAGNLPLTTDY
jgi:hypothetical protein